MIIFQIAIGIGIAIAIFGKDRDRDRDLNVGDRAHALGAKRAYYPRGRTKWSYCFVDWKLAMNTTDVFNNGFLGA